MEQSTAKGNSLGQLGFQTSAFTGTQQKESTGQGLARVLMTGVKATEKIGDINAAADKHDKKLREEYHKKLYMDAKLISNQEEIDDEFHSMSYEDKISYKKTRRSMMDDMLSPLDSDVAKKYRVDEIESHTKDIYSLETKQLKNLQSIDYSNISAFYSQNGARDVDDMIDSLGSNNEASSRTDKVYTKQEFFRKIATEGANGIKSIPPSEFDEKAIREKYGAYLDYSKKNKVQDLVAIETLEKAIRDKKKEKEISEYIDDSSAKIKRDELIKKVNNGEILSDNDIKDWNTSLDTIERNCTTDKCRGEIKYKRKSILQKNNDILNYSDELDKHGQNVTALNKDKTTGQLTKEDKDKVVTQKINSKESIFNSNPTPENAMALRIESERLNKESKSLVKAREVLKNGEKFATLEDAKKAMMLLSAYNHERKIKQNTGLISQVNSILNDNSITDDKERLQAVNSAISSESLMQSTILNKRNFSEAELLDIGDRGFTSMNVHYNTTTVKTAIELAAKQGKYLSTVEEAKEWLDDNTLNVGSSWDRFLESFASSFGGEAQPAVLKMSYIGPDRKPHDITTRDMELFTDALKKENNDAEWEDFDLISTINDAGDVVLTVSIDGVHTTYSGTEIYEMSVEQAKENK